MFLFAAEDLQYNLLMLVVLAALPIVGFVVVWALRHWGYTARPWPVVFAAYGLPLLAALITYIVLQSADAFIVQGTLMDSFFRSTWQPLFLYWQALILLFAVQLLFPGKAWRGSVQTVDWSVGLISGLGCGIISAFLLSLLTQWQIQLPVVFNPPDPPGILHTLMPVVALVLLPLALESFFRGVLLEIWIMRFGWRRAVAFTAILSALLTFQPALFLPAGISAVVFALLRRERHFFAVVLAHVLTNAVIFLLGWQWVF
jgi:membrane protease YdiL (CAAX protease family)